MAKPSEKRGESGASNAKNVAFRYGGSKCNLSTLTGNPAWSPRGAGSKLVQAMSLGVLLPNFEPSDRLVKKTDAAMARCTSELLK